MREIGTEVEKDDNPCTSSVNNHSLKQFNECMVLNIYQ